MIMNGKPSFISDEEWIGLSDDFLFIESMEFLPVDSVTDSDIFKRIEKVVHCSRLSPTVGRDDPYHLRDRAVGLITRWKEDYPETFGPGGRWWRSDFWWR